MKEKDGSVDLTLVLACYNEEKIIRNSVQEILSVLKDSSFSYEIIFVDDCSRDKTRQLIDEIIQEHPHLSIQRIFNERNVGRGGTVTQGLLAGKGLVRGFIDIDLEVHARYIPSCVRSVLNGADLAVGWRIYKFKPLLFYRHVLSRGYLKMVHWLFDVHFKDTETGYKFFSQQTCLSLLIGIQDPGWFWDTEVMIAAARKGLKIAEIPCLFIKRYDKRSTVRVVRDSIDYFRKLIAFRSKMSRSGNASFSQGRKGWNWRERGSFRIAREMIRNRVRGARRVLDVGCTMDLHSEHGMQPCTVFDLILEEDMHSRIHVDPRTIQVRGRCEDFPFKEGVFDLVLLWDILHVVKDEAGFLLAVRESLRPGGALLLSIPSGIVFSDTRGGNRVHERRYRKEQLCRLIERCGLDLEHITYFNSILFPVEILSRWLNQSTWNKEKGPGTSSWVSRGLQFTLSWIFSWERHWVTMICFPFGLSIMALARKPE